VLGALDPIAQGSSRDGAILDVLGRAELRLRRCSAIDPVATAQVEGTLASDYFDLSLFDKAESLQHEAESLLLKVRGPADFLTLQAQYLRVRSLDMLTRFPEANALLEQADRHAGEQIRTRSMLAMVALWARGGNDLMQARPDQAMHAYEEAEAIRVQVVGNSPVWLFRIQGNMAWCENRRGNRSRDVVQRLQDLSGRYSVTDVGLYEWSKVHLQYGLALRYLDRLDEAKHVMQDAVDVSRRMAGPQNYLTGLALNHLAVILEAREEWEQALATERLAYPIFQKTIGRLGRAALIEHGNLGILQYRVNHPAAAVVELQSTRDDMLTVLGPESGFTQVVTFYLSAALNQIGRPEEAERLVEALEPRALMAVEPSGYWQERVQGLKGEIYLRCGKHARGRALLAAAVESLERKRAHDWFVAHLQRSLQRGR
jgi:tetratricopeptide (TPR) repeat protein